MTKPYSVSVLKGTGHPWQTGDAHWDMMVVKTVDQDVMTKFEDAAEKRGWKILCQGADGYDIEVDDGSGVVIKAMPCTVFYKPQNSRPGWAEDADYAWPSPENWT